MKARIKCLRGLYGRGRRAEIGVSGQGATEMTARRKLVLKRLDFLRRYYDHKTKSTSGPVPQEHTSDAVLVFINLNDGVRGVYSSMEK